MGHIILEIVVIQFQRFVEGELWYDPQSFLGQHHLGTPYQQSQVNWSKPGAYLLFVLWVFM